MKQPSFLASGIAVGPALARGTQRNLIIARSAHGASFSQRERVDREQMRGRGAATPNPSLKRSANGRPPGPVWRYAVHFRQPGPGVLPLSPA